MPWIFHIHAKFYEIDETGREPSIPYDEIIPVLIEGGYTGHLSSEYEGQRHIEDAFEVDGREQVKRQQQMFARLLGETV
jgi:sugar phosphate isomerase/epimerase